MIDADLQRPPASVVLKETVKLLWGAARARVLLSVGVGLVQALFPVATVWLTARVVDAVAAIGPDAPEALQRAILLLAGQGVLGGLGHLLQARQQLDRIRIAETLVFSLKQRVLEKNERLPLTELMHPASHNQINRFQAGGVEAPLSLFSNSVSNLRLLVTLSGYLVILFGSSWVAGVSIAVVFLVSSMVQSRVEQREYGLQVAHSPLERQRDYLWSLLLRLEAASELRLFGLGSYLRSRWADLYLRLRGEDLDQVNHRTVAESLLQWVNAIMVVGVAAGLLVARSRGELTVGDYVALGGAAVAAHGLVKELAQSTALTFRFFRMTGDLFAFFDLPEIAPPEDGWTRLPTPLREGITCHEICFTYPGSNRPALDKVSLHIAPGERIAIVGANGASKTTLVKCILGLYPPSAGSVTYDGVDLRQVDPGELSKRTTAAFQDYIRYSLRVRENIGLGNLALLNDDQALLAAAMEAGADFIPQLPQGVDTDLDRTFSQEGTNLSQGQWQKLALARTLLSRGDVVVLDEPSSALDPQAEANIFRSFDRATRGKTVLFISHRLGSVRMADRIIVMGEGRIVESGSHEELLALGGEYARMYQAQAEWYQATPGTAAD